MTLQLHEYKPKTSAYWRSPEGMMRRIEMLSQSFTYQVVNNSLMFYGYSAGIKRVRWATRGDARVCPICGSLEGRIYRKGQFLPPLPAHANCLTPETEVNTHRGLVPIKDVELGDYVLTHRGRYRQVIQLHKNPYEGKIYGLGGGWLTGNHPVLTPKGWASVDSVEDGEQVLSIAFDGNRDLTLCNLDPDKPPTPAFEEILLSSVEPPLGFASVPVTPVYFDGNLQVGDGEVQVIDVEGILRDNTTNLKLHEDIEEAGFKIRHLTLTLPPKGSSNPLLPRDFTPSSGIVGISDLGASLIGRHQGPLKLFSLASTPNMDPRLDEAPSNGGPRHPEGFGDCILRDPADVPFNDLLNGQLHLDEDTELISHMWHKPITTTTIDIDIYKNQVYNLSVDEDESYTIGKQRIIVHNCRCGWELLFDPKETPSYVASILKVETGIAPSIYPDNLRLQRDLETAIKRRVDRSLGKLPDEHTRLLKTLHVKRELAKITIKGERVSPAGLAYLKLSEIDIAYYIVRTGKETMDNVVAHEVGHLVQEAMDGTNRQYWRDYYNYVQDTMSSDYGKTNNREGFATNYERMINPKRHNPDDLNEQVVRLYSGQRLEISKEKFKSMIDDLGEKQYFPDYLTIELLHQYDLSVGLETP